MTENVSTFTQNWGLALLLEHRLCPGVWQQTVQQGRNSTQTNRRPHKSGPVLECARAWVGTANDTAKVAEGVATWSKKGDGLDNEFQDGTHCVATSETAPEATPKSVGNSKKGWQQT